jgi:zinc protease
VAWPRASWPSRPFPKPSGSASASAWSASLREANTRPGHRGRPAFTQAVYGSHPYGYEMTEETLARIQVADMQRFTQAHLDPAVPRQGQHRRAP